MLRFRKYSKFERLKLSVTGDTANRLGLHSVESCALYPQESFPPFMSSHCLVIEDGTNETGSSVEFLWATAGAHPILPFFYIS